MKKKCFRVVFYTPTGFDFETTQIFTDARKAHRFALRILDEDHGFSCYNLREYYI